MDALRNLFSYFLNTSDHSIIRYFKRLFHAGVHKKITYKNILKKTLQHFRGFK